MSPPNILPTFSKDTSSKELTHSEEGNDHELSGLLSGVQKDLNAQQEQDAEGRRRLSNWLGVDDDDSTPIRRSRRQRVVLSAGLFIMLILGATFLPPFFSCNTTSNKKSHPNAQFVGSELRSNGTHDFKRTVLLVSIDGLRADYLDRGFTPHLLDISKKGLRAKYMKPIFPTLTFPNHWTLMTGLYAESHGIVANNFWDPQTDKEFHYNQESSTWVSSWWFGEPMWETTSRANVISANLMWPGPPKTSTGVSPTYFVPWKDHIPLGEKLDQIMRWIDLPLEERPQLILAYEPSLDQAGHKTGPYSSLVNETLKYVDTFAKDLHTQLVIRNLTEIVDVVFVSDHGMTDTSHPELVYMDDDNLMGEKGVSCVEHDDGWPSKGMRFSTANGCNGTQILQSLLDAAEEDEAKGKIRFDVYTLETMPERYHFSNNERIAPVYVVPRMGYALTTRAEGDDGLSKGNHGYDNDDPSMYAMFVAHGPFSTNAKDIHSKRSSNLFSRSIFSRFAKQNPPNVTPGWHSTANSAYVMKGFQNVELYGLVMKLLGLEKWSAPNNGTVGFWDKYLEF